MAARAAEAVVEIEVPEGGVEVVQPHQAHHAAAEPDAFRVAGRAVDRLRGLDEFVGLALVVLGGVGRIGGRRFAGFLGAGCRSGRKRRPIPIRRTRPETAKWRKTAFLNSSTRRRHTFPDLFPALQIREDVLRLVNAGLMPSKWVPNAAGTSKGIP